MPVMKNLIFVLLVLAGLQSCFLPKKLYKVTDKVSGIKESLNGKTTKDIRVLIIHGVSKQKGDENYSQDFIARFGKQFSKGKNENMKLIGEVECIQLGDTTAGKLVINRYELGANMVSFYSIYWNDVTQPYKEFLFANHKELKGTRVAVNNGLKKKVTIDAFSDFVLYANPIFRKKIQLPVKETLEYMYNDKLSVFKQETKSLSENDKDIYLISGSLGSKIVLDVLSKTDIREEGVNCDEKACTFFYNNLSSIFMLSNQVPLLSLIYATTDYEKEKYVEQNYFGICGYLNVNNGKSIKYVSFYDPNDLLGFYPISDAPDCVNAKFQCSTCETRINRSRIVLNNTLRGPFRLLTNPAKAHVGVWKNKRLIRILVNGHEVKG
jgi:hypothetical protein